MISNKCTQLVREEHNNVVQAFNLGNAIGTRAGVKSAAAQMGGPALYIDCKLWDEQMGNPWFGTIITHEVGHTAGYGHPKFPTHKYVSECEDVGSEYCPNHCKEWTAACDNHVIFGSVGCGF